MAGSGNLFFISYMFSFNIQLPFRLFVWINYFINYVPNLLFILCFVILALLYSTDSLLAFLILLLIWFLILFNSFLILLLIWFFIFLYLASKIGFSFAHWIFFRTFELFGEKYSIGFDFKSEKSTGQFSLLLFNIGKISITSENWVYIGVWPKIGKKLIL